MKHHPYVEAQGIFDHLTFKITKKGRRFRKLRETGGRPHELR